MMLTVFWWVTIISLIISILNIFAFQSLFKHLNNPNPKYQKKIQKLLKRANECAEETNKKLIADFYNESDVLKIVFYTMLIPYVNVFILVSAIVEKIIRIILNKRIK